MPAARTVDDVIELCRSYYALPGNSVGGSLHVVLDHGNVENTHVEFCRAQAERLEDAAGVELAVALARLSRRQRYSVYRRLWS